MNRDRLDALLDRLPAVRVLVVGDFFLDKYLIIDHQLAEVSLETGLEAHQVVEMRTSPGAAGTVANRYTPCVGKDATGPRRPRGPALYAHLGAAGIAAVVAQAMHVMESVEP